MSVLKPTHIGSIATSSYTTSYILLNLNKFFLKDFQRRCCYTLIIQIVP